MSPTNTTVDTITEQQIRDLLQAAWHADDFETQAFCERALGYWIPDAWRATLPQHEAERVEKMSPASARAQCVRVIRRAEGCVE